MFTEFLQQRTCRIGVGDGGSCVFYRVGGVLAQFRSESEANHWLDLWSSERLTGLRRAAAEQLLGPLAPVFARYLPRPGRLLEAGCGPGHVVWALTKLGYSVEGVDRIEELILRGKQAFGPLPLVAADVRRLPFRENEYQGYISLGVVEHDVDGPAQILSEAYRVLAPGAIAVFTVPQLTRRRRCWLVRAADACGRCSAPGMYFFQYYFSKAQFASYLAGVGFKLIKTWPYGLYEGLRRDYGLWRRIDAYGCYSWRIRRLLRRLCEQAPSWLVDRYGHMRAYICSTCKPPQAVVDVPVTLCR